MSWINTSPQSNSSISPTQHDQASLFGGQNSKRKSIPDDSLQQQHIIKISATDPTSTLTSYCWDDVLKQIRPLQAFSIPFPSTTSIITTFDKLLDDQKLDALERARGTSAPPCTLPRTHFEEYTSSKLLGDPLTDHQMQIVDHYITILDNELQRDADSMYSIDKACLLDLIALHYSEQPADRDRIDAFYNTQQEALLGHIRATVQGARDYLSLSTNTPTDVDCTEALAHLVDLILIDTPSDQATPTVIIPDCTETTEEPVSSTFRRRNNAMLTPEELASHPCLATSSTLSAGELKTTRDIVRWCRTDGSIPSLSTSMDTAIGKVINNLTKADSTTYWTLYFIILGWTPSESLPDTLEEITHAVKDWLRYSLLDEEWFEARYFDNAFAVTRQTLNSDTNSSGYIIKLKKRIIVGSFYWTTAHSGTIYPMVHEVKGRRYKTRTYQMFALREPIDLRHIQIPSKYPPILAIRGLPVHRDHSATTALTLITLQQWFEEHQLNVVLVPQLVYHQVVWVDRIKNGIVRTTIAHPDLNEATRKLESKGFAELVIDVRYIGTTAGQTEGYTADFLTAQTRLFNIITITKFGVKLTFPPYPYTFGGATLECCNNLQQCIQLPRRYVYTRKPRCTVIEGILPGMTAFEGVALLAKNSNNHRFLRSTTQAYVLPNVNHASPKTDWRLVFPDTTEKKWLETDPLVQRMTDIGFETPVTVYTCFTSGYEDAHRLFVAHEDYGSQHDTLLPSTLPPFQSTNTPHLPIPQPGSHIITDPTTDNTMDATVRPPRKTRFSNFSTMSLSHSNNTVSIVPTAPSVPLQTPSQLLLSAITPVNNTTSITLPTSSTSTIIPCDRDIDLLTYISTVVQDHVSGQLQVLTAHQATQDATIQQMREDLTVHQPTQDDHIQQLRSDLASNTTVAVQAQRLAIEQAVLAKEEQFLRKQATYEDTLRRIQTLRRQRLSLGAYKVSEALLLDQEITQ